jgi:hypothetical protein
VVQRAIESLRELPPVRQEAVGRILEAAARSRASDSQPHDDDLLPVELSGRSRRRAIATVGAIAAILLVSIVTVSLVRGTRHPSGQIIESPSVPNARLIAPVSTSREAVDAALIPTQFIFDGKARHVSLVGDFNNWDEHAAQLEREPGSTLWSVTVPIVRGRHVYAFLVDSVWTIDKRAPVARDPDFGVTGSVILVGRP